LLIYFAWQEDLFAEGDEDNRFTVDGTAQLNPAGLRANASLSFTHLVLEDLALQLRGSREIEDLVQQLKDLDAHAVLSGDVGVEVQPGKPLAIQAVLSELAASISQEITEPGGQVTTRRIGLHNDGELRATVTGDRIVLSQARFITDAGRFSVTGVVQGVGFRPFVYRLAQEECLAGSIGNDTDGVTIEIEGPVDRVGRDMEDVRAVVPVVDQRDGRAAAVFHRYCRATGLIA